MQLRKAHLWVGLIASLVIFVEAFTGILLLHTDWLGFDKQVEVYELTDSSYTDDVDVLKAMERASLQQKFSLQEVRIIMNHTLGDGHYGTAGNYKIRLKDDAETLYVFDTKGNLLRKEINLTNNWVRNFHYGELNNYNISWLIDLAAIAIIFLTVSGVILSIRELFFIKVKK